MALDLKELDSDERLDFADTGSRIGIIMLFDNGRWMARRHSTGYFREGSGTPDKLEHGFWVIELPFDEVVSISRGMRGIIMRWDKWIRLSFDDIRAAFNLRLTKPEKAIEVASTLFDRVYRLTQEAVAPELQDLGFRSPQDYRKIFERASSLATGIATVNLKAVQRSCSHDKRMIDHFTRAYQAGIFLHPKNDSSDDPAFITLKFNFPRLSYAKQVTCGDIPGAAHWQSGRRPDSQSSEAFIKEALETGHPLIFKAVYNQPEAGVPDYIQALANSYAGTTGDAYRSRFIADEVALLSDYYDFSAEGVLVGDGWRPSSIGALIGNLEELSGGSTAARASWSVGLAAENILASAMRVPRKETPGQSAEAVWIAARDRLAMTPAIRSLCDVGATLISASCGNITVRCPADPELISLVVNSAWEAGLVLQLEDATAVNKLKVTPPVDRSLFGGADADYFLAAITHMRKRNALWNLDAIVDAAPADRKARFLSFTDH